MGAATARSTEFGWSTVGGTAGRCEDGPERSLSLRERDEDKRCCLERDRAASVADLGARDEQGRLIGRPFIDTLYQGKRVRAVGNQIVFRPPEETKHEFFVHVLANTLGDQWKQSQDKLPPEERHPIIDWVDAWDEMRRDGGAKALDRREEQPGIYSSTATGDLAALIALAYDLYSLRHAMVLRPEDPIVKRLGNRDQFQGARYEIAVAAIFVRAGYQVEWITETSRKLPEFVARRDGGRVEIAVEAKSRPRPGLLGNPGERPDEAGLKADLSRLLRDALEKEADGRPFVIFLDLNLPPGHERTFQEWIEKLHDEMLAWTGVSSEENPDPYSAVVFTNFSWQWDGDKPTGGAERFLVLPFTRASPFPAARPIASTRRSTSMDQSRRAERSARDDRWPKSSIWVGEWGWLR